MATKKRSWLARCGRITGILTYALGFAILILETQMHSPTLKIVFAVVFGGGILLAVAGLFAEDMADQDERDARQRIEDARPPSPSRRGDYDCDYGWERGSVEW